MIETNANAKKKNRKKTKKYKNEKINFDLKFEIDAKNI